MRKWLALIVVLCILSGCGVASPAGTANSTTTAPAAAAPNLAATTLTDATVTPQVVNTLVPTQAAQTAVIAPTSPVVELVTPTEADLEGAVTSDPASGLVPVPPTQAIQGVEAEVNFSDQIRQRLANHLGVAADSLTLSGSEAVEWPDGGLGCPEPGVAYIQVIIFGYRLAFSGNGGEYIVHTNSDGKQAILCVNGRPAALRP